MGATKREQELKLKSFVYFFRLLSWLQYFPNGIAFSLMRSMVRGFRISGTIVEARIVEFEFFLMILQHLCKKYNDVTEKNKGMYKIMDPWNLLLLCGAIGMGRAFRPPFSCTHILLC